MAKRLWLTSCRDFGTPNSVIVNFRWKVNDNLTWCQDITKNGVSGDIVNVHVYKLVDGRGEQASLNDLWNYFVESGVQAMGRAAQRTTEYYNSKIIVHKLYIGGNLASVLVEAAEIPDGIDGVEVYPDVNELSFMWERFGYSSKVLNKIPLLSTVHGHMTFNEDVVSRDNVSDIVMGKTEIGQAKFSTRVYALCKCYSYAIANNCQVSVRFANDIYQILRPGTYGASFYYNTKFDPELERAYSQNLDYVRLSKRVYDIVSMCAEYGTAAKDVALICAEAVLVRSGYRLALQGVRNNPVHFNKFIVPLEE